MRVTRLLHHLRRVCAALVLAVPVALTLAGPSPGLADPPGDRRALREAVREGRVVPLSRIIAWIGERYRGRVIEAELERDDDDDDDMIYVVDLLTEAGTVLKFRFRASDGAFLEVAGRGIEAARIR
ncbi:peptidase [Tistrella mobilis]|uniref:PepSY domain-containing protein n=1 Tax=Tistrella mobilis TaxID=171437 RepID=UPI003557885F